MEAKPMILVIDDEPGIREMLAYELGQQGYSVITAGHGREGLERIREHSCEIVISDIKMPVMDGIETLAEIKKISPETEVILATGYGTMETAIEGLRQGAFDYISKPFNLQELDMVIQKALEKRQLQETIALYEVSRAVFSTIKADELLRIIVDVAVKLLRADDAVIMLFAKDNKLYIAAAAEIADANRKAGRPALGARLTELVARDREPLLLMNSPTTDLGDLGSVMALPLFENRRFLGTLIMCRDLTFRQFTGSDLKRANLFSSLASLAVTNAGLYRDLQEAQTQLIRTEKLAALGQLAGGIAHEINNPMTAILGLAQINQDGKDPDSQEYRDLKDIETSTLRCKQIVGSLLAFARREPFHLAAVDVNRVIDEVMGFCGHQFELKNIRIIRDRGGAASVVPGDFQQLLQVFLNLLMNARDAMPAGGAITITMEPWTDESGRPFLKTVVTDTGGGIPESVLHKVFDPFFTTKPVGEGTGLGLAISRSIIENHGGTIEMASCPGAGTSAIIRLPVNNE